MKNFFSVLFFLIGYLFLTSNSNAQSIGISGVVYNGTTGEVLSAASVVVKGSEGGGAVTGNDGAFTIRLPKLPADLVVSHVGFEDKTVHVTNAGLLSIKLALIHALGQEVVVSASRLPEKILESPVTIERVGATEIKSSPAANYYDIINRLKGVNMVYSSLTYGTPTTRGFASSGNTRFTQIMDGMDNQAPGLNFAVGMVIGLTELDVESFELLSGASSALYGPGGMNGTLIVRGKDPFAYPGLSVQVKQGVMNLNTSPRNPTSYSNIAIRYGQPIGKKFAFKIATEYINADDWMARDYRNFKRRGSDGEIVAGDRVTDPNYDGINVYGDEATTNLKSVLTQIGANVPFLSDYISQLPANIPVSRTGYTEYELIDPKTKVLKLTGGLYYKINSNITASFNAYWGTGNTVYTGSQRYSLRNLKMGQYKVELTHKNWFLRGYTTQEDAGESHNLTFATIKFNETWKSNTQWFTEYGITYANSRVAGRSDFDAHQAARSVADAGRLVPGSQAFTDSFNKVIQKPIPFGGLFKDKSDLYMMEGQYNLSSALNNVVEVLVGANWKQYVLNSQGTLFADKIGEPIKINEVGGYVQIAKELIPDRLKLTASARYDKNETFEKGRVTPRITLTIQPAKNHNIRLSFQTAYRFPSTQMQWIDLDVVSGRLLGGVKQLWDKYDMTNNPVYDTRTLAVVPYKAFKPESVNSYELGYKSLIKNKLLIDAYCYISSYDNFLNRRDVVQNPGTPQQRGFSIVYNSVSNVMASGWGIGLDYLIMQGFKLSVNVSSDTLFKENDHFIRTLNTPKYRYAVSMSKDKWGKFVNFGASISYRWQKGYFYDGDFADAYTPAFHTLDAQVSYKFPKLKSVIKLGGTNILNQYYETAIGNPSIGGLYYISLGYNL